MSDLEPAGLEYLASLERLGAATETSLELPADLSYERYEALGVALGRAHRTVTWMLADWLCFGEKRYGETYTQAAAETKLREETLMGYASVARRVPRELRRAELSFGSHAAVAALDYPEQKRWLEAAAENGWKREDIRSRLRDPENLGPATGSRISLEEAARDLVRSAKQMGDGFLVGRLPFAQLCGVLGEGM